MGGFELKAVPSQHALSSQMGMMGSQVMHGKVEVGAIEISDPPLLFGRDNRISDVSCTNSESHLTSTTFWDNY